MTPEPDGSSLVPWDPGRRPGGGLQRPQPSWRPRKVWGDYVGFSAGYICKEVKKINTNKSDGSGDNMTSRLSYLVDLQLTDRQTILLYQ